MVCWGDFGCSSLEFVCAIAFFGGVDHGIEKDEGIGV